MSKKDKNKKDKQQAVEIKNRKAEFEYFLVNRYTAGMKLAGTEIKSIRAGKANLVDAYCFFRKGELYVKNMHIAPYGMGSHYNHEPLQLRKLLLTKRELKKINDKVRQKGFTIIPLRIFINERGFAKLEIATAQGKKKYDKRKSIKEKDVRREMERTRF